MFKPLIHFQLISLSGLRKGSIEFLCKWSSSFLHTICWSDYPFPIECSWLAFQILVNHQWWGQERAFLGFLFCSIGLQCLFFFFFLVKFYLFHFSLCWVFVAMQAFSSCRDEGLLLFLVQGLLIVVASLVEHGLQCKWTSVAAEHGLSSGGSWALKHRLNSCGTWA